MEDFGWLSLIALSAYFLGAIPSAYLVVRLFTGKNVLEHGTGNAGTMNTHRTTGSKWMTVLVLLGDLAKGLLAWLFGDLLAGEYFLDKELTLIVAGVALLLGHNYSIFLKFRGGKGLATIAGFFLILNPWVPLIWIACWVAITAISRYMVLGQMLATVAIAVLGWWLFEDDALVVTAASIPIIIAHVPRMVGVWQGREPKMYYKEKVESRK